MSLSQMNDHPLHPAKQSAELASVERLIRNRALAETQGGTIGPALRRKLCGQISLLGMERDVALSMGSSGFRGEWEAGGRNLFDTQVGNGDMGGRWWEAGARSREQVRCTVASNRHAS